MGGAELGGGAEPGCWLQSPYLTPNPKPLLQVTELKEHHQPMRHGGRAQEQKSGGLALTAKRPRCFMFSEPLPEGDINTLKARKGARSENKRARSSETKGDQGVGTVTSNTICLHCP